MTIFEKGRKIYKRLHTKLEKNYRGKIVAIEPNSGYYVVGKDELDAALKAQGKFPGKIFDFFRIGYPAMDKFRRTK